MQGRLEQLDSIRGLASLTVMFGSYLKPYRLGQINPILPTSYSIGINNRLYLEERDNSTFKVGQK